MSYYEEYDFVPKDIEDKGMAIVGNIQTVLEDVLEILQR